MKHAFQSFYLDVPLVRDRVWDVFEPEEPVQDISLFFVHGGAWRNGDRNQFHEVMEAFCRHGIRCATTDYRLSGVTAWDQLSDIRSSYDDFISYLKERQASLKVAVLGSSSGAHLASLLLCAEPGECGETVDLKNEWVTPSKGILLSAPAQFTPWEDIFPPIWEDMQRIAGIPYEGHQKQYDTLSLRSYIRHGNPPLFFAQPGNEHIFPSEMTLELTRQHETMGIDSRWKVYEHVEHGFFYTLTRRQQREAFQDFMAFLAE